MGWGCKRRGCCTAQPHARWALAAGAWGKGMLSPSPWKPGLELQGRLRQGGESVMGAPCSLLAPRQQASGWVGRGGECSRDGGSFYMRSCSLGFLQLPWEQVKHLALGGLVGTKPALAPRGSCWGRRQLAPQYRWGARAGSGPVRSPTAHIGWTQTLPANGAAGIYSDSFGKRLHHTSTRGLNP